MARLRKKLALSHAKFQSQIPGSRLPALPPRPTGGHKGTFGTVIVVGGSSGFIGAPALCAAAALRTGVGLARIAAPPEVLPFALVIEPSATGIQRATSPADALNAIERADPDRRAVLAFGPGLGQSGELQELVMALLAGPRAMVLDADGLNNLATALERHGSVVERGDNASTLVMTPHPGEFRRLAQPLGITGSPTDAQERPAVASELARACHAVVVLKGRQSVISDGERHAINRSGNVALATAGTGDVLTGVIASLLAQGLSGWNAAVLGTHLHGLAADLWARRHGHAGLTALDLARLLPDALSAYRRRG